MSDRFLDYEINRNVNKDTFQYTISQLPVNLLDFALISNMRHRAYGFRIYGSEDCLDKCCLNNLARRELWRILFNIQQNLIANRRLSIAPTYVEETQFLDSFQETFKSRFGAIEKTNVIEEFNHAWDFTVSPFVIENVTLRLNGSIIEAVFDRHKVKNPNRVILRDSVTYEQFDWQSITGYPKIEGSNWVMPVGIQMPSVYVTDPTTYKAHLQHYDYVIVDIPDIKDLDLQQVVVFHPDTLQILPFVENPYRVTDSTNVEKIRLIFYVWTLGKPEFDQDIYDMVEAEFYKLYDSLSLYERTEIEIPATIYIDQRDNLDCGTDLTNLSQETTDLAWTTITEARYGMLRYLEIYNEHDNEGDVDPSYKVKTSGKPYGKRYKIRHYYKVNPLLNEHLMTHSLEEIRRAIVAKTAATIELESCHCVCATNTYITKMQTSYTKTYVTAMGSVGSDLLYGNKHGDMVFADVIERLSKSPRGIVL